MMEAARRRAVGREGVKQRGMEKGAREGEGWAGTERLVRRRSQPGRAIV